MDRDSSYKERVRWTDEALERVEKAPDFVRPGIYRLVERRARERGIGLITSEFLTEIRNESMMLAAQRMKAIGIERLSMTAFEKVMERMGEERREVLEEIVAYLRGRKDRKEAIIGLFKEYLETTTPSGMPWESDALELLSAVEGGDALKGTIEGEARQEGYRIVTKGFLSRWLGRKGPIWTEGAKRRLERIPIPLIRRRVERAVIEYASSKGCATIDEKVFTDAVEAMGIGRDSPLF